MMFRVLGVDTLDGHLQFLRALDAFAGEVAVEADFAILCEELRFAAFVAGQRLAIQGRAEGYLRVIVTTREANLEPELPRRGGLEQRCTSNESPNSGPPGFAARLRRLSRCDGAMAAAPSAVNA